MNILSSINQLQEYAIKNNLPIPKYDYENITKPSEPSRFICHCSCNGIIVSITDSSKKAAKHKAAEKMLESLQSNCVSKKPIEETYPNLAPSNSKLLQLNTPICKTEKMLLNGNENFVSILNEYCSKNRYNYPVYNGMGLKNGLFVIQCVHQSLFTEGLASTKKQAKQNAASKMLDIILRRDSPSKMLENQDNKSSITSESSNCISKQNEISITSNKYSEEEIISKGMSLSIENLLQENKGISFREHLKNVESAIDTIDIKPIDKIVSANVKVEYAEELKAKLKKMGIEFNINELSNNPTVLMLSVTSGTLTGGNYYVESGDDYEKVLVKLLEQVIIKI